MKERRGQDIKNIVLTKDDLRRIWKTIYFEFEESKKSSRHTVFTTAIETADGARYESERDDILQDDNIIDLKKIVSINIRYNDFPADRSIDMTIRSDGYNNQFTISGSDDGWVAKMFEKINTVFRAVKPQTHWLIRNKNIFLFINIICLGYIFLRILFILVNRRFPPTQANTDLPLWLLDLFLLLSISWLAIPPAVFFRNWVLKLWPSIEFDFGPEHEKIQKNKRLRLGAVFILLIVPLLMAFAPDAFKAMIRTSNNSITPTSTSL